MFQFEKVWNYNCHTEMLVRISCDEDLSLLVTETQHPFYFLWGDVLTLLQFE